MHFDLPKKAIFALLALVWLVAGSVHAAPDTRAFWLDAQARPLAAQAPRPASYRALQLDVAGIRAALAAPGATLALPHPTGGFTEFTLADSGTMPPELAARYPEIRSYVGVDGRGNRARIDISPLGVNAMVFERSSGNGIWVVRPDMPGEGSDYLSFYRKELAVPEGMFSCGVHAEIDPSGQSLIDPEPTTETGIARRTYRAAVAANRQYTNAVGGGTVAGGLAAVVVAMNRVNEVYENDFSVHMTLIANNDTIIYTNENPGPYSNSGAAIDQNQSNLDSVIGSANYDIGHVFTTGSGGIAGLGVVCRNGQKALGTTGLGSPLGDVFYIDYVAHEMGHQFGGNHTFNATTNSCGGGNRAASAAYEPGSGSTIQAYAGICGTQNLQSNSDAYFHAESLREMGNYISTGAGSSCAVSVPNPNTPPVVNVQAARTIPANTPFELAGSASGAGAGATYTWEQYDRGAVNNNFNVDPGTGPIIRSLLPATSPHRFVPRMDQLVAGTTLRGEILPTTNRTLTFRLTARDNANGGGTTGSADVVHTVVATAGPFTVAGPAAGSTWNYLDGAGTASVTWNVANTDVPPVACSNVDIDLSRDGGLTYPVSLALNVPNSGSATVPVPNEMTAQARVKVRCANNIFFNISPGNFTIAGGSDDLFADGFDGEGSTVPPTLAKAFSPDTVTTGAASTLTITLANANATAATLTAALTDTFPTGLVVATPPAASTTCGGTLGAVAGTGSVSLGSGATIPAGASCTVVVNVQSTVAGSYENTLAAGALQTDLGANAAPATATLTVTEETGACPAQLLQDPGFEATEDDGGDNPFWASSTTQGDSTFWSPLGGATVHAGSWTAWFGGYGTVTTETHEFSQTVTIPASGAATLKYWRRIDRTGTNSNVVTFTVDGTVVRTENLVTLGTSGWTEQNIDLSTYADGQPHLVKVSYTHSGGGQDANYFIDDVTLDCSP